MLESHLTTKCPNRHTKPGCKLLPDFSYGAIIETNSPSGALKIIEHLITWLDIIALHLSNMDNYVPFSSFLVFPSTIYIQFTICTIYTQQLNQNTTQSLTSLKWQNFTLGSNTFLFSISCSNYNKIMPISF